jgi:hypothetical protein
MYNNLSSVKTSWIRIMIWHGSPEDEERLSVVCEEKMAARIQEKKKNTQRIRVMIFLSVCYSANTGGSGTLTGKYIPRFLGPLVPLL